MMSRDTPLLDGVDIFYIAAECVIAVLSILGNSLVVVAVKIDKSLRNTTFFFIVSLAVADISLGVILIPLALIMNAGIQIKFYGCLLMACVILAIIQGSVLFMLMIAIDRFLKVKIPTRYRMTVTPYVGCVTTGICWLAAALIGIVPMFGWNNREKILEDGNCTNCYITCTFTNVISFSYMMLYNFLGCFFPLTLMIILYAVVFNTIRKQFHPRSKQGQEPLEYYKKEMKLAKSLLLVLLLFTLTFLPLHVMNILNYFCLECNIPKAGIYIIIILSHSNSALNPMVYAFRIKKFRQVFITVGSLHIPKRNEAGKRVYPQVSTDDQIESNRTCDSR
ncbi:adenosine receptor A1-like [Protopterus annectens]|uniref:adenosine receptor A1-like n=1 Tax=Protopterus annectens TaxID=7888 RepID=UPI001CFC2D53|nr:adenosine receptor A1-like [Protopterus annectens]